ncbi:mitochondrial ribosomal protein [Suhomyces tanzawaensis NRRL Y-17324]|uniref:Small ribosomal subunit protein mS29 n=1 Tax=Suhomyces tanzawaensis NRRL Y-17324 TaxID=984487 RepID=A0A1E4SQZ3_9ASCO|nr:mitochondrial ribosomal protein [Suhomyces tanzawaensis NRRL Y-17324]ODV81924.1 mitochondrial ribosomal protein [Suhomyces tanzawaensis NRRL Y-17324]
MLRLARLARAQATASPSTKAFSTTSVTMKKAAPSTPARKTKIAFKVLREQTKTKKPGMTHLEFKDAVGALGFEKMAADLSALELNKLSFEHLAALKAQVTRYDAKVEPKLKTLGSFKKLQHHELFQNPVSLVSENTLRLAQELIAKLDSTASKDNRICLVGPNGVGKSTLLTQAKALALAQHEDVVLLHIDNGVNLVNGSSDYIFNQKSGKYQQPMLTKRWIYKLRQVNEEVFKKMKLTRDISFQSNRVDYNLKKNVNTVYELLLHNHDFGKFAPTSAFAFFVDELVAHSKNFPVLFSIDNFNGITDYSQTKYHHPDFSHIHLSEFEMGDFVLKVTGGALSFAKGGVLLAKTSDFGQHRSTLDVALGIEEYDPYSKKKFLDVEVANTLKQNGSIKPFEVKTWTKDESKELLKFYQDAGVLFVNDYKTKESNQTAKEILEEKAAVRAGKLEQHEFDPVRHFDRIVNNQYTISGGNPAHLLKASAFIF